MESKRICALTMCRNDSFYLRRWVQYYGAELGRENLYVYLDGKDQEVPGFCDGIKVVAVDKIPGKVTELERQRLGFLSERAAELLAGGYDLVIGADTDEFLIPDPALGLSLAQFLSRTDIPVSASGLGVDVGQRLGEEGDIRDDATFLSQRHYARLSTRYTKPSVISKPVRWGRGFHRIKGHNYHIIKDLYLFHFGYFDMARIKARFNDKSRIDGGWEKHLKKRSKNIMLCTRRKARKWESAVTFARIMETVFRPPYALNKPALLELAVIVRIPERFSKIV